MRNRPEAAGRWSFCRVRAAVSWGAGGITSYGFDRTRRRMFVNSAPCSHWPSGAPGRSISEGVRVSVTLGHAKGPGRSLSAAPWAGRLRDPAGAVPQLSPCPLPHSPCCVPSAHTKGLGLKVRPASHLRLLSAFTRPVYSRGSSHSQPPWAQPSVRPSILPPDKMTCHSDTPDKRSRSRSSGVIQTSASAVHVRQHRDQTWSPRIGRDTGVALPSAPA